MKRCVYYGKEYDCIYDSKLPGVYGDYALLIDSSNGWLVTSNEVRDHHEFPLMKDLVGQRARWVEVKGVKFVKQPLRSLYE